MRLFKFKIIVFLVALSNAVFASNTYEYGVLDNGFEYHFLHVPSEPGRIDVRLKVGVGASDEVAGEKGVAHMVEHMVFHAVPQWSKARGQGWVRGKHFNAMTSFERTLYMFSPPKGRSQLEQTLENLKAMITPHKFLQKNWKNEKEVVMAEWRSQRGLNERMNRKRSQVVRSGSRQARYGILGSPDSIQTVSVDTLQAFHQKWYVPNNMQLMISGDLNSQATKKMIQKLFGSLKMSKLPDRTGDYYEPKLHKGWQAKQIQDRDSGHSRVMLMFRLDDSLSRDYDSTQGIQARLIDKFTLGILKNRLKNQQSALPKTMNRLVIKKTDIGHHTVAVAMFASVVPDGHTQATSEMLKIRQQLLNAPVTHSEFNNEIKKYKKLIEKAKQKTTLPEPFGEAILKVSTRIFNHKKVYTQAQIAQRVEPVLSSVTQKHINQRMHEWLNAEDKLVQLQAPSLTPVSIPTPAQLDALTRKWQQAKLPPLLKPVKQTQGAFVDAPTATGEVVALKSTYPDVVRWRLANGDIVVVLQHEVAKDKTYIQSISDIGYLTDPEKAWQRQLAGQLVWQSGPKGWTPKQIDDWKKLKKMGLSYRLKINSMHIKGEVPNAHFEDLLHLYHAYQTTAQLGEGYREGIMALIRRIPMRGVSRRSKKDQAITQLRYEKPAYVEPTQAQLMDIEKQELLDYWREINRVPNKHYILTSQSPEVLKPLVAKYLGGIQRKKTKQSEYKYLAKKGVKKDIKAIGEAGRSEVYLWSFTHSDWSPEVASQVAMLNNYAKNKLKATLRDKAMGVYSVRFNSEFNTENNRIETRIRFSTEINQAEKLSSMASEVMENLSHQITKNEVLNIQSDLKKGEASRLKKANTWLQRLVLSDAYYGDARYLKTMHSLADKVSVESLKQVANKMWSPNNQRVLIIKPELSVVQYSHRIVKQHTKNE